MKQIQAIYREEGKLKDISPADRLKQRQVVIKPLVEAFFTYLKQKDHDVPGSGPLRKAVNYALNQENHLRVFLTDPGQQGHGSRIIQVSEQFEAFV